MKPEITDCGIREHDIDYDLLVKEGFLTPIQAAYIMQGVGLGFIPHIKIDTRMLQMSSIDPKTVSMITNEFTVELIYQTVTH